MVRLTCAREIPTTSDQNPSGEVHSRILEAKWNTLLRGPTKRVVIIANMKRQKAKLLRPAP